MLKICIRCKIEKTTSSFSKRRSAKSGINNTCKKCCKEQFKTYYIKNKEKLIKKAIKYNLNNRESYIKSIRLYSIKNRKKINSRQKIRRIKDIEYRLACILRTRLNSALKGNYKKGSAIRDLGCSIKELRQHLETQFKPGMSWNNYGKWHIDHIQPLSSFNLKNLQELQKACNYKNLQPLWAEDNLRKNNKLEYNNTDVMSTQLK